MIRFLIKIDVNFRQSDSGIVKLISLQIKKISVQEPV